MQALRGSSQGGMLINDGSVIGRSEIAFELENILAVLGKGRVNSVAYDTAWVARLDDMYSDAGFGEALPWLRRQQHADGSWGGDVLHYHDRFICTLASAIALQMMGRGASDMSRVERAVDFLWREHLRLRLDAHETIGFPVLALSLIEEAHLLGLDVPHNVYKDADAIDRKLSILQHSPHLWRNSTMSFSLEAIRALFPDSPDFLETNGSVGTSPAATAALLLRSEHISEDALDYLAATVLADGGAPNVAPIDTFEIAWGLNFLRNVGAISPDEPAVRRALNALWSAWSPEKGMGFSSFYSISDLDDTAVGYSVLRWGGYPVDTNIFAQFEEEDHFRCFPHEIDPSISAALRLVGALKMDDGHPKHDAWMHKVLGMLRRSYSAGAMWFDKWHASPYYPLLLSVHALRGLADDIVSAQIRLVLASQHQDGGWGFYGYSTPEETAYALLALLYWDESVNRNGRVDAGRIRAGAAYLTEHFGNTLTPLWLGKCLYTPEFVVRSVIVAAIHRYHVWCDDLC